MGHVVARTEEAGTAQEAGAEAARVDEMRMVQITVEVSKPAVTVPAQERMAGTQTGKGEILEMLPEAVPSRIAVTETGKIPI